jgi:hypothetical protein
MAWRFEPPLIFPSRCTPNCGSGRIRPARRWRALIIQALESSLEHTRIEKKKGVYVIGPLIKVKGKSGPRFPVDETPHDLILY